MNQEEYRAKAKAGRKVKAKAERSKQTKSADKLAGSYGSTANTIRKRRNKQQATTDAMGSGGHNRSGKYGF